MESFVALEAVQLHPWESLYNADRVLIGYDDARRVVTLHDGSFGPAWEIGYDDFDTMWAARGRDFMVARPADGSMRPSSSSGTIGPLKVTSQERGYVPPVVGIAAIVVGGILVFAGRKPSA